MGTIHQYDKFVEKFYGGWTEWKLEVAFTIALICWDQVLSLWVKFTEEYHLHNFRRNLLHCYWFMTSYVLCWFFFSIETTFTTDQSRHLDVWTNHIANIMSQRKNQHRRIGFIDVDAGMLLGPIPLFGYNLLNTRSTSWVVISPLVIVGIPFFCKNNLV